MKTKIKKNGKLIKNEDKNEKNGKIVRENTKLKKFKKSREKMKKNDFFYILLIISYKKLKKMKKFREKIQNWKIEKIEELY